MAERPAAPDVRLPTPYSPLLSLPAGPRVVIHGLLDPVRPVADRDVDAVVLLAAPVLPLLDAGHGPARELLADLVLDVRRQVALGHRPGRAVLEFQRRHVVARPAPLDVIEL